MALFELVNERPLPVVARRFRVNRGALQSLQQQAATYACVCLIYPLAFFSRSNHDVPFADMICAFCDRLGWVYLRGVLDGFAERLAFGVRRDLTELVRIEGIDATRARAFHAANITTVAAMASARVEDVARVFRTSVPFVQ
jgi:DNA polymerase theta